jgi:hypothetical protein
MGLYCNSTMLTQSLSEAHNLSVLGAQHFERCYFASSSVFVLCRVLVVPIVDLMPSCADIEATLLCAVADLRQIF